MTESNGHLPGQKAAGGLPDLDDSDDVDWGDESDTLETSPPSFTDESGYHCVSTASEPRAKAQSRCGDEPTTGPFPRQIGPYEVLVTVASDPCSTVVLARVATSEQAWRHVTLKLIHAHALDGAPALCEQAVREMHLASRVHHPNVMSFLEVGRGPFGVVVMDDCEGDTLFALMRWLAESNRRLPLPIAARIVQSLLHGLDAVHSLRDDSHGLRDVVHGHVDPHNVLVGIDGVTRLRDPGAAAVGSWTEATGKAVPLDRMAYWAPERIACGRVDQGCDIWAAGVIAWELFSGRRLFPGTSLGALIDGMRSEAPNLRAVRGDIPVSLDAAVASALALNAKARCPSARGLVLRLQQALRSIGIASEPEVGRIVDDVFGAKLRARRTAMLSLLCCRRALSELEQTAMRELADDASTTRPGWAPP